MFISAIISSKMNKEYWVVAAIALLILSSVLESFAGPVQLQLTNQLVFLSPSYLSVYPLTAVAIGVRALGLLIFTLLIASLIEKQYFLKATLLFAAAVLAQLYAIQQLAVGVKLVPVQYTLSVAYAGIAAVPAILVYILKGAFSGVGSKVSGAPEEKEEESQKRIEKIKKLKSD